MSHPTAVNSAARIVMPVRSISDRDEVRRMLDEARPYAAPVYGYLEDRFIPHAHWYIDGGDAGQPHGLLFWVDGAPGANLYVQGPSASLEALLRQVDVPRYSFMLFEESNETVVREHFLLRDLQRLLRMRVDRSSFEIGRAHV